MKKKNGNYLRACCSSTGKWYLRWDLRSALSSSSSSCCRIRSYPWHSSRGSVAGADGVPAWRPHNTAPARPDLASATACHTPKTSSYFKFLEQTISCTVLSYLYLFILFFFFYFLFVKLFYRMIIHLNGSNEKKREKKDKKNARHS